MGLGRMKKKILFLTGTRADFGKLKPLIRAVDASDCFEYSVFVTGMHVLSRYGYTVNEVYKEGFKNIHTFINHIYGEPMEMVLANTINGLSRYITEYEPDLLVVHGDRAEALAGAIVGALRNILVAHVEGGEISGTVDELIRHSVTKLAHLHFVSNELAAKRLLQLGENEKSIFVIGSPDIDIMLSDDLPGIDFVLQYYEIPFQEYGVGIFHPVTTELKAQRQRAEEFVAALLGCGKNFVVIFPNNDTGSNEIFASYEIFKDNKKIKIMPSMRFEYFLSLLKNAAFIIGNSSAGIREAPVYGIPTINIGTRQLNRFNHESILNVGYLKEEILAGIKEAVNAGEFKPCHNFGHGDSARRFMEILKRSDLWSTPSQKQFNDILEGDAMTSWIRPGRQGRLSAEKEQ